MVSLTTQRQDSIVLWGLVLRSEHAGTQQEATALRKVSGILTSPFLHNIVGTMNFKICRNIKSTDMGVHIVPFQTTYPCHTHPHVTLSQTLLLSSQALVLVCADHDGEFCGKNCSPSETGIVPSWLLSTALKWDLNEHFSLLLGIYHSDSFAEEEKEMRNWAILLHFCTSVICHLTISTVGSQWFAAQSHAFNRHTIFKELKNVFLYFSNNGIPSSLPQMCW